MNTKKRRIEKSVPFDEHLHQMLRRDFGLAEAYLNEMLKEGEFEGFLLALRHVAEAYGGMTKLAKKTKLSRQHLYRIFSNEGNPEFETLETILSALGFKLFLKSEQKQKKAS